MNTAENKTVHETSDGYNCALKENQRKQCNG